MGLSESLFAAFLSHHQRVIVLGRTNLAFAGHLVVPIAKLVL